MDDPPKKGRGRPKKTDRSKDRHSKHGQLRVAPELWARLKRIAEKANRPASWEARAVLEHHAAKMEKELGLSAITPDEIDRLLTKEADA